MNIIKNPTFANIMLAITSLYEEGDLFFDEEADAVMMTVVMTRAIQIANEKEDEQSSFFIDNLDVLRLILILDFF